MAVRVPGKERVAGDPDATSAARAKAGDAEAFESLVSRHERAVFLLALRMLKDRDDAMEAAQDVFMRAFRALRGFRGEASFRTWLLGIAINVCRSRLTSAAARSRRRTVSLEPLAENGSESRPIPLPDPGPDPESVAYGGELRAALLRALDGLSSEHREILVLREMNGLDYVELSRALGSALGTVKSRLARARSALRQALEGVWP